MLEGHPKGPNLKSSHLILPNPTNPLHMSYHSYQVPVTGLRYHWVLFHDDFLILPPPVFHDHVPILPFVYLATVSKGGVFEFLKNQGYSLCVCSPTQLPTHLFVPDQLKPNLSLRGITSIHLVAHTYTHSLKH